MQRIATYFKIFDWIQWHIVCSHGNVYMVKLSFREQVQLFYNSDSIFSLHGSALLNKYLIFHIQLLLNAILPIFMKCGKLTQLLCLRLRWWVGSMEVGGKDWYEWKEGWKANEMGMFERVSVFGYGELNRVDLSNEVPKIVRKKRGNRDMNLYMSRIVNWGVDWFGGVLN